MQEQVGRSREAQFWQVLGVAFLLGGALPLTLNIMHFAATRLVDPDALDLGVWCSGIILLGFVALGSARIRSARDGRQNESVDWIWTALMWVAIPVGAAIFDLQWGRSMGRATLNQKAKLFAGGFIFLTGIVAL